MKKENKRKKIFFENNEFVLLEEIFSEAGAMLIGFLFSGRSIKNMYKIRNDILKNKYLNKRRLINLQKNGYIEYIDKNEIKLTKLGKEIFNRTKIVKKNKDRKKEERWDGKWRMISFDIPNEFSDIRNLLRSILLKAGFIQMQKSIYIFPFEINEILDFLNENEDFKKYIVYSEICNSTNENLWKKEFKKNIENLL